MTDSVAPQALALLGSNPRNSAGKHSAANSAADGDAGFAELMHAESGSARAAGGAGNLPAGGKSLPAERRGLAAGDEEDAQTVVAGPGSAPATADDAVGDALRNPDGAARAGRRAAVLTPGGMATAWIAAGAKAPPGAAEGALAGPGLASGAGAGAPTAATLITPEAAAGTAATDTATTATAAPARPAGVPPALRQIPATAVAVTDADAGADINAAGAALPRGAGGATPTAVPIAAPGERAAGMAPQPERSGAAGTGLPRAGEPGAPGGADDGAVARREGSAAGAGLALQSLLTERGADTAEAARITVPRSDGQAPALSATAAAPPAGVAAAPGAGAASAPAASSAAAPPTFALTHAPDEPGFTREMGAHMRTLIRDGMAEARLQLHPAELGRVQVTVSTDGDQARLLFVTDTTAARDAIEQSMPRLREMLEQGGLQLAQSDVDHRGPQRGHEQGDPDRPARGEGSEPVTVADSVPVISSTLIDTYI